MEITIKEINKARVYIMGVAALLVILVHLQVGELSNILNGVHRLSQLGVDIFMFLTGIGCYQSLSKRTTLEFYKRRLTRILIPYCLVFLCYGLYKCAYEGMSIYDYWSTHSIVMFFIDAQTRHWFVAGVLLVYLLAPLFYKIVRSPWYWVLFAGIIILSSQLWFSPISIPDNIWIVNELFICRIPVYMFGLWFGYKITTTQTAEINGETIILAIITFASMAIESIFCKINTMAILHYISIPGAYFSVVLLTVFFNKVKLSLFKILGLISLESYLVNEKITSILMTSLPQLSNLQINLISFVLTIGIGYVFYLLSKGLTNIIQRE